MLHKDLTGLDLHIPKLHAPTHLVGGTDPLGLAESEITGLVTDLSGKAPTVHSHAKADITDFPSLGTAAALNVDADIATLALPANTTISAAGAELINDADAAAQRATLGTAAYSEGTWTPVVAFGGNSVGVTYNTQMGNYARIGNMVHLTGHFYLSSKGTSTGAATITGMPFATKTGMSAVAVTIACQGISFVGQIEAVIDPNATIIQLKQVAENSTETDVTDANFVGTLDLELGVTYFC